MAIKNIIRDLLRLFFPKYCPICDNRMGENEGLICLNCISNLPLTFSWHKPDNSFYKKIEGKCVVLHCCSLLDFENENITQKIIHTIKYRSRKDIGIEMGAYLGEKMKESLLFKNIDIIVPIPLHPTKLRKRGFNQALVISKGISKSLGVELNEHCVRRTRNTTSQTKLDRIKREENVRGVFSLINPLVLEGKRVLIVDDVATSGSTISSLVNEINNSCPEAIVSVAALASTKSK